MFVNEMDFYLKNKYPPTYLLSIITTIIDFYIVFDTYTANNQLY
jgi:hypothetical protein